MFMCLYIPDFTTCARTAAQADSAHAALLDCARSCSPQVEDTTRECVVIDIEGLEKLLGPPRGIAARLQSNAEELGLKINVGIAANPDAAILTARGFPGITIIPPGEEEQALGRLPVSALNPNPEVLETLERWGISRLSELAALPSLPLSERLGQEGVRLQERARGQCSRALIVSQEAERFEEAWELETPAATLDELDFVLSNLLNRLTQRLAIRSFAAQELRLRLEFAEGMEPEPSLALEELKFAPPAAADGPKIYERIIRFPLPLRNPAVFFKLWRLRLESETPRAPVVKIAVAAEPARPRAQQGGLFMPLAPDPEKLELTLARLTSLVGEGNAGSPELIDTHRPHAFRMTKFNSEIRSQKSEAANSKLKCVREAALKAGGSGVVERRNSGAKAAGKAAAGTQLKFKIRDSRRYKSEIANSEFNEITNRKSQITNLKSALRLFRPPVPAYVELAAGKPARLSSSLVRGRITSAAGPWRKSGGWWEEEKWDRDEWGVEIRNGKTAGLYSIYYDRACGEWYLEGEYD